MTRILAKTRGMTLLELMIALVIFGVIAGAALSALRSQSRSFRLGSERMTAVQNLTYAASALEFDLRTAGSNVPDEQPFLVYAGTDVVAFSADYVTNVANDPFAVYYDPDAPSGAVTALRQSEQITIPQTTFVYPVTDYDGLSGVGNSPAETIIFYFRPDSSTTRTDDYALFRQINGLPAEMVARNLLQSSGLPFFRYHRLHVPASAPASIELIPQTELPVMHSAAIHGSPSDADQDAWPDSIRAVEVNFTTTNGLTGSNERQRAVTRIIRLPNAGLAVKRTCGDDPMLGTILTATVTTLVSGEPAVDLAWDQATDESGGENDVRRYVMWRRLQSEPQWGDPYLSLAAGQPTYVYTDAAVTGGDNYLYAVAAQDCTPSLSELAIAGPVTIP